MPTSSSGRRPRGRSKVVAKVLTDAKGIPEKPFFRIGEVARLCGVKPYVLRFWEGEFSGVKPEKTKSNQRVYRRRDVELLLEIRHLLYEKKFTIEGAKAHLRSRTQVCRERELDSPTPTAPWIDGAVGVENSSFSGSETSDPRALVTKLRNEIEELISLVAE